MTGSGTQLDPYVIWDVNDLQDVGNGAPYGLGDYYELGVDIPAAATAGWNWDAGRGVFEGFEPIGNRSTPFTGSLDGNGYKITNLYMNREPPHTWPNPPSLYDDSTPVALFGEVVGGSITNLGLEDVDITCYFGNGRAKASSLVGYLDSSTVDNCYATGSVTSEIVVGHCPEVAGLIATIDGGTVTKSYSTCTVVGISPDNLVWCGGFVYSVMGNATIQDCYATGNVTANTVAATGGYNRAGGFLVWSTAGCIIERCYATGNCHASGREGFAGGFSVSIASGVRRCYATGNAVAVTQVAGRPGGAAGFAAYADGAEDCYATGDADATVPSGNIHVGGLIGRLNPWTTLTNCYSTGAPTAAGAGTIYIGGLCGQNLGTAITDCFWDTQTSGQATSDGGTGKTTAEMKRITTFSAWDIEKTVRANLNNGYPFLSWQIGNSPIWLIPGGGGGGWIPGPGPKPAPPVGTVVGKGGNINSSRIL